MSLSTEQHLTALLAAFRDGDVEAVARIWREMTPVEQEAVALDLLSMQTATTSGASVVDGAESPNTPPARLGGGLSRQDPEVTEVVMPVEADPVQAAPTPGEADATQVGMPPVEPGATELIPKSIDDLRGLTGSEIDEVDGSPGGGLSTEGSYRSRWLQRWRRSALGSALAVTMLFALTGEVSSYGPMEWAVAIFATLIGGGLLVGTLVNFVVAAI